MSIGYRANANYKRHNNKKIEESTGSFLLEDIEIPLNL